MNIRIVFLEGYLLVAVALLVWGITATTSIPLTPTLKRSNSLRLSLGIKLLVLFEKKSRVQLGIHRQIRISDVIILWFP